MPISIVKSVQTALIQSGRAYPIRLTIVRVSVDEISPMTSSSSSFPLPVEIFVVPLPLVLGACWELAQRHLNLRSINVIGIPMKKSRKQANLGRRFRVSFLYPNTEPSEFARLEDQNELSSGAVQLGTSPWYVIEKNAFFYFWFLLGWEEGQKMCFGRTRRKRSISRKPSLQEFIWPRRPISPLL
jgi:hypothetical protein